ncbi:anti-sigma factor antagonist [Saccharopolyspora rhizosphaerae]|uniref:Anti-sigma factor antagonist n=2 Tax=Saccharopolyspora rhizosphaerae TaxID=2492662 RepID=A0A3R8P1U6_9PSEU|nr:anti-sigma factor antagonist [Saccharopolyspora rhizosphaerae]
MASEPLVRPTSLHPDLWRRAALAVLEDLVGRASVVAADEEDMTINSVQRGAHYTVVTVSGPVDLRAARQLAAHLTGLHNAGAHHVVVDLSRVTSLDENLLGVLRRVEAEVVARNGVFELMGLEPNMLHAMEDEPLSEVFTLYRAALEETGSEAASWAALRCPQGLAEVPEPRTARRHRRIFDVGARPKGSWGSSAAE